MLTNIIYLNAVIVIFTFIQLDLLLFYIFQLCIKFLLICFSV